MFPNCKFMAILTWSGLERFLCSVFIGVCCFRPEFLSLGPIIFLGWRMLSCILWDVQHHLWLLLTRYWQNPQFRSDNQKCLETLPSVPSGIGVGTNSSLVKNQCFILTFLLSRCIYFHSSHICHWSCCMREGDVFSNYGWKENGHWCFAFCNARFKNFHITLETQGWKVQLTFFSSVSTFISQSSCLSQDNDY